MGTKIVHRYAIEKSVGTSTKSQHVLVNVPYVGENATVAEMN